MLILILLILKLSTHTLLCFNTNHFFLYMLQVHSAYSRCSFQAFLLDHFSRFFLFTFIIWVLFDSDCLVFDDHCMRCTPKRMENDSDVTAYLSRSYKLYSYCHTMMSMEIYFHELQATSKIWRQTTTDQITNMYTNTGTHAHTHTFAQLNKIVNGEMLSNIAVGLNKLNGWICR